MLGSDQKPSTETLAEERPDKKSFFCGVFLSLNKTGFMFSTALRVGAQKAPAYSGPSNEG
jgi:hypothetical protein